jgi:hypothetical protein
VPFLFPLRCPEKAARNLTGRPERPQTNANCAQISQKNHGNRTQPTQRSIGKLRCFLFLTSRPASPISKSTHRSSSVQAFRKEKSFKKFKSDANNPQPPQTHQANRPTSPQFSIVHSGILTFPTSRTASAASKSTCRSPSVEAFLR